MNSPPLRRSITAWIVGGALLALGASVWTTTLVNEAWQVEQSARSDAEGASRVNLALRSLSMCVRGWAALAAAREAQECSRLLYEIETELASLARVSTDEKLRDSAASTATALEHLRLRVRLASLGDSRFEQESRRARAGTQLLLELEDELDGLSRRAVQRGNPSWVKELAAAQDELVGVMALRRGGAELVPHTWPGQLEELRRRIWELRARASWEADRQSLQRILSSMDMSRAMERELAEGELAREEELTTLTRRVDGLLGTLGASLRTSAEHRASEVAGTTAAALRLSVLAGLAFVLAALLGGAALAAGMRRVRHCGAGSVPQDGDESALLADADADPEDGVWSDEPETGRDPRFATECRSVASLHRTEARDESHRAEHDVGLGLWDEQGGGGDGLPARVVASGTASVRPWRWASARPPDGLEVSEEEYEKF